MNEIITVGGEKFTATNVETGLNTISFALSGLTVDEAYAALRNAKSLTVGEEAGAAYGQYPDVRFDHLTVYADGSITATMRIPTEMEKQVSDLQASQAEQDEAIAELMYGGGGEDE